MKLMQRIGPSGTRLTELAEQAQVTKQTAGFLVDQLEKGGWVVRVPDPTDGRARLVCMTERTKEVIPVAETAVLEVTAEWEAHLGNRRMRQLREALTRLREITDPYASEQRAREPAPGKASSSVCFVCWALRRYSAETFSTRPHLFGDGGRCWSQPGVSSLVHFLGSGPDQSHTHAAVLTRVPPPPKSRRHSCVDSCPCSWPSWSPSPSPRPSPVRQKPRTRSATPPDVSPGPSTPRSTAA